MQSAVTVSPEPVSAGRAWGIVVALFLAFIINYIDRQIVFSIFPVLTKELHATPEQLGLVGTVFIWVYSIFCPIVGRMADLIPAQRLVAASILLWSLSTAGTATSQSVNHLYFWRAMMGITEALYIPAAMALIGIVHSGATRSRALSFHASGQMIGIIGGGWAGGWIAEHWGWRNAFLILGVIGIAYAPVLWLVIRRVPKPAPAVPAAKGEASNPRQLLTSRCYWALALAFFWLCVMLWMLYAWLPNFIYERYQLSLSESGLTATLFLQTSSTAGLICGGFLADWLSRKIPAARLYLSAFGLLMSAPFAWLALNVDSLLLLKLSCVGFGWFSAFMAGNIFAATYDVIDRSNYGLGAGTINMIGGLSGGLAILLAGHLKTTLGIHGLMGFGAAAAAASALVLFMVAASQFRKDRVRIGLTLRPATS